MSPPSGDETWDEANDRKERILGSLFARLHAIESRGMWLRLSRERDGDELSLAFARFPSDRRARLMLLLADEARLRQVSG